MLEGYISNDYVKALVIFVIVFVIIRLAIFVFYKVLPVFTRKTKTSLDDEILKKASMPLTFLAILIGIRFAIEEIYLKEGINQIVEKVIFSLIIIFVAVLVYEIINSLIVVGYRDFGRRVHGKVNESLLQFFHSMLVVISFILTFLVVLASWGVEIGPLLAGLGVAGIAIAFALQSTLSNVFGGISMILDRSISVGDLIDLGDGTKGHVVKINLRSTKVNTLDNEMIIVPNSKLSDSNIKNLALPDPATRVVVPFSVAYGSDVAQVKKLILGEIAKVKNAVKDKGVIVRFMEMADSSLNFKAYFYVNSYDDISDSLDDANTRIYNALNKAGISIPFPQMDVNLKK